VRVYMFLYAFLCVYVRVVCVGMCGCMCVCVCGVCMRCHSVWCMCVCVFLCVFVFVCIVFIFRLYALQFFQRSSVSATRLQRLFYRCHPCHLLSLVIWVSTKKNLPKQMSSCLVTIRICPPRAYCEIIAPTFFLNSCCICTNFSSGTLRTTGVQCAGHVRTSDRVREISDTAKS
jgi:hypothetical protein